MGTGLMSLGERGVIERLTSALNGLKDVFKPMGKLSRTLIETNQKLDQIIKLLSKDEEAPVKIPGGAIHGEVVINQPPPVTHVMASSPYLKPSNREVAGGQS